MGAHRRAKSAASALADATVREARGEDVVLNKKLRTRLLRALDADFDFFYGQLKLLLSSATREEEARIKLVTKLLDKILVEERHVLSEQTSTGGELQRPIAIYINGVARGTVAARERAIELSHVPPAVIDVPA